MSTCGGSDASLLDQHQDGRLALVDSLLMASRVRLSTIPSVEEALLNLGTFAFVSLHLFYAGGQNLSVIADLLRLIGIPEDLHTEVQGMSSSPHLATTLLFNVLRRWSLYLNRCVSVSSSESLDAPGYYIPSFLDPILTELEGAGTWAPSYRHHLGIFSTRPSVQATAAAAAAEAEAVVAEPPLKSKKPPP